MKDIDILDRIIPLVAIGGLIVLALIYGAATTRYQLPLSQRLTNAFVAADAWYDEWRLQREALPEDIRKDHARRNAYIVQNAKTAWNKARAYPGYTLITTGYLGSPYLVDMEGKVVHHWKVPYEQIWSSSICNNPLSKSDVFADGAYLFPNGDVLINYGDAIIAAPYGCGLVKVDKDSNILWVYKAATHHDFTVDKAGNIYVITRETITRPPPGLEGLVYPMAADFIVKLSPDGHELNKISLLDAFQNTSFELLLFHGKGNGDTPADFFHTNSIDVLSPDIADKFPRFKAGDMLVSIRSFDTLAVIDSQTHKVTWAHRGPWLYQHAASFLPNGNMMVLDNWGHVEYQKIFSRVIEFDPVTLQTKWHFAGSRKQPFYASMAGRLQRLPNGNTLICESQNSRIFEVTPDKEIVWSYILQKTPRRNEFADAIFTSMRYDRKKLHFLHEK